MYLGLATALIATLHTPTSEVFCNCAVIHGALEQQYSSDRALKFF